MSNHPGFAAVGDDGSGGGDNQNSETCKAPVNPPPPPTYQHSVLLQAKCSNLFTFIC